MADSAESPIRTILRHREPHLTPPWRAAMASVIGSPLTVTIRLVRALFACVTRVAQRQFSGLYGPSLSTRSIRMMSRWARSHVSTERRRAVVVSWKFCGSRRHHGRKPRENHHVEVVVQVEGILAECARNRDNLFGRVGIDPSAEVRDRRARRAEHPDKADHRSTRSRHRRTKGVTRRTAMAALACVFAPTRAHAAAPGVFISGKLSATDTERAEGMVGLGNDVALIVRDTAIFERQISPLIDHHVQLSIIEVPDR